MLGPSVCTAINASRRLLYSRRRQARSRGNVKSKSSVEQSPPKCILRPFSCTATPAVATSHGVQLRGVPSAIASSLMRPKTVPTTKCWPCTSFPLRTMSVSTWSPSSAPLSYSNTSATAEGCKSTPVRISVRRAMCLYFFASPGVRVCDSTCCSGTDGSAARVFCTRATRASRFIPRNAEIGTAASASRVQSMSTTPCSKSRWHCRRNSARVSSTCASGKSILFNAKTTGTLHFAACWSTSSVWTSAPRSTDTTTTATSAAAMVLPLCNSKASCPGVSNKVTRCVSKRKALASWSCTLVSRTPIDMRGCWSRGSIGSKSAAFLRNWPVMARTSCVIPPGSDWATAVPHKASSSVVLPWLMWPRTATTGTAAAAPTCAGSQSGSGSSNVGIKPKSWQGIKAISKGTITFRFDALSKCRPSRSFQ
mmetsp:Transcript_25401/g.70715  ORF Transcript_25401/g.70715 Transcript_25401/m.70715 type:complete len:423 (+) Transcript_25401:1391-2659(+)